MPSTTESSNESVGTITNTVPILENNSTPINQSITNLNLDNHHLTSNNLTNGLMTNDESYFNDNQNSLINNNNLTNNLLATPTEQPSHYT